MVAELEVAVRSILQVLQVFWLLGDGRGEMLDGLDGTFVVAQQVVAAPCAVVYSRV